MHTTSLKSETISDAQICTISELLVAVKGATSLINDGQRAANDVVTRPDVFTKFVNRQKVQVETDARGRNLADTLVQHESNSPSRLSSESSKGPR